MEEPEERGQGTQSGAWGSLGKLPPMARREDKDCEPTHSAGGHRKLRVPNPAHPPPRGKEVSPGKQREQTSGPLGLSAPSHPLHEQPHAARRLEEPQSPRAQFGSRDCHPALHVSGTSANRRLGAPDCAATGRQTQEGKGGQAPKRIKSSHRVPDVRGEDARAAKGKAPDLGQRPFGFLFSSTTYRPQSLGQTAASSPTVCQTATSVSASTSYGEKNELAQPNSWRM